MMPKGDEHGQPSRAVQDYLKAIHSLDGAERMVSPLHIAERLQVRRAVGDGHAQTPGRRWLDRYEPGCGCQLTPQGISEARRVIRRHRLVELLLTRVLGLDWSEVDAEAEALEHAISPRLEQAIAAHLGEPLEDPHGHIIPTREGAIARRNLLPLHKFHAGQSAVIREARDDSPERLRRWRKLGLTPGARVQFLSHEPLDDLFEIQVGGQVVALGSEGLSGLLGEAVEDDKVTR